MRGPYISVSFVLGASYAFPSGLDRTIRTSYERQACSCAAIVTHGTPVHQQVTPRLFVDQSRAQALTRHGAMARATRWGSSLGLFSSAIVNTRTSRSAAQRAIGTAAPDFTSVMDR